MSCTLLLWGMATGLMALRGGLSAFFVRDISVEILRKPSWVKSANL